MSYVVFLSIAACLVSYLVACGLGWDLRRDIRAKAPVLESEVFPVSFRTIMYFPFFSPLVVLAQSRRISKLRPEFAAQFNKFRIAAYSWCVSCGCLVLSSLILAFGS